MTDFTLYVGARDDLGGYYYYAREDILSDYEPKIVKGAPAFKSPPVKMDYIVVSHARSKSEVVATAYVEAMKKLNWTAADMLGRGHVPGSRNERKFGLKVVLDLEGVDERVEAIVRRVRVDVFRMEVEISDEGSRRVRLA